MRRQRNVGRKVLGSSAAEHATAGEAVYERIITAAKLVRDLARQGNCGSAFTAYGQLERAYGEASAHAYSGGRTSNPIGTVAGAQAAFSRACVAGRHPRFARGSQSPEPLPDQTIVTAPFELRGKRKVRKRRK